MTQERERYLARCSERENSLRSNINIYKKIIKEYKAYLRRGLMGKRGVLKKAKLEYSNYRHELNRLKGMDRVAVPSDAYTRKYLGIGICVCGFELDKKHHKYCPNCGRKILWEKVSKCTEL